MDARAVEFSEVHAKVFKDVKDFKVAKGMFRNCIFRSRLWSGNAMCFRSRTELESRSRSGGTGTTRTDRMSRTEYWRCNTTNERMQEILRMTQGLDPMQVLRLRQ